MILDCTLAGAAQSVLVGKSLELTIQAPAGTSGADIQRLLARDFGTGTVSIQGTELAALRVGTPPFAAGAVLIDAGRGAVVQRKRQSHPARDASGLALAVHSGVGAGTVVALSRGNYTIGRSGTRIVIADAEISREHARLIVTDSEIMLEDLDSANGTFVDGQRVRFAPVTADSDIRCGNSRLSLVFMDGSEKTLADAGKYAADPIVISGRSEPGNRAAFALTAILPLAIGVGLALATGMWMFLAFAAASAASLLVPLITGRRRRRDLAAAVKAAVRQDSERRRRAGPSLAMLALGARPHRVHAGVPVACSPWLRLGEALQPANVKIEPAARAQEIPTAGMVPVLLDPSRPSTVFIGPRPLLEGMLMAIVMQLGAYDCAGLTRVVIHGPAAWLPLSARFLPRVALAATPGACHRLLADGLPPGIGHGVLMLAGTLPGRGEESALIAAAVGRGWQVLQFVPSEGAAVPADVDLSGREAVFRKAGDDDLVFIPDLAPPEVFARFCRQLASVSEHTDAPGQLPDVCGLGQLLRVSARQTAARWNSSRGNPRLAVPLGLAADGVKMWDPHTDGPHLLVAGTTGSGKSELLRTLVLSLALSHPPDRVNFLFVDFKGGSGLGPLAGLVHCVGLLTDLSEHALDRTLISLHGEIKFREQLLADAQVPDVTAFRSTSGSPRPELPHLIIIIDEFRMLVDDAPDVLRELMRIASIGRSLGIHLVMATQRPQGALTADIRANVTCSIALRVQSEMESLDIIGTKAAAGIGVDSPGRAYMVRGTEPAQEFQAATTGLPMANGGSTVRVQLTTDFLADSPAAATVHHNPTPAQAAFPVVELVQEVWSREHGAPPRLPVVPPLPDVLREPEAGGPADLPGHPEEPGTWSLVLGLMDLPQLQCTRPLTWEPATHSHLAFIGSPASGANEALELAVRRILAHPREAHCYFLDATGAFRPALRHGRTGACAGVHELRLAVRILERLTQELGRRLSRQDAPSVPLVLVISGWGAWVSAFRSGPLSWAEDLVHNLVRDGRRAGITVAISGERELVTARFSGSLSNHLYFPAGSNEDSRIAWPKLPSSAAVKGRAVAFGPVAGHHAAVCQHYQLPDGVWNQTINNRHGAGAAAVRPFRVEALPACVPVDDLRAAGAPDETSEGSPGLKQPGIGRTPLLVGVSGDEPGPAFLQLPAGSVFPLLGHPGSGKSSALRALQALNPGTPWLCPHPRGQDAAGWQTLREQSESGQLPRDGVLLVDDADLMRPDALHELAALHTLGHTVVLAANYNPLILQRVPLMMSARIHGSGLLLAPRTPLDGDMFGVRFDVEAGAPPGRGVLVSGGLAVPLQVAWSEA